MKRRSDLREILEQDVLLATPALLGWDLVRGDLRARIVEVEAYRHDDPACHAFGKTKMKNMALYADPGRAYVYFNYGNHWMLNVVAHPEGDAAAVLIRAARPLSGLETMFERRPKARKAQDLLSGPGKLAAAFGVTGADNMVDLLDPRSELRLEPGEVPAAILAGPRVGIALGKAHDYPWRFVDAGALEWASKPRPPGSR
ncbi:MAG TPA: DNA-3-methyladenine glycosylase [Fimbriimonadaceae bacterium]|nr:DNA-3-methyladenine glycosylase [Fimbriimonadaceae bacterium]